MPFSHCFHGIGNMASIVKRHGQWLQEGVAPTGVVPLPGATFWLATVEFYIYSRLVVGERTIPVWSAHYNFTSYERLATGLVFRHHLKLRLKSIGASRSTLTR